jgi:hypothetical protein
MVSGSEFLPSPSVGEEPITGHTLRFQPFAYLPREKFILLRLPFLSGELEPEPVKLAISAINQL